MAGSSAGFQIQEIEWSVTLTSNPLHYPYHYWISGGASHGFAAAYFQFIYGSGLYVRLQASAHTFYLKVGNYPSSPQTYKLKIAISGPDTITWYIDDVVVASDSYDLTSEEPTWYHFNEGYWLPQGHVYTYGYCRWDWTRIICEFGEFRSDFNQSGSGPVVDGMSWGGVTALLLSGNDWLYTATNYTAAVCTFVIDPPVGSDLLQAPPGYPIYLFTPVYGGALITETPYNGGVAVEALALTEENTANVVRGYMAEDGSKHLFWHESLITKRLYEPDILFAYHNGSEWSMPQIVVQSVHSVCLLPLSPSRDIILACVHNTTSKIHIVYLSWRDSAEMYIPTFNLALEYTAYSTGGLWMSPEGAIFLAYTDLSHILCASRSPDLTCTTWEDALLA